MARFLEQFRVPFTFARIGFWFACAGIVTLEQLLAPLAVLTSFPSKFAQMKQKNRQPLVLPNSLVSKRGLSKRQFTCLGRWLACVASAMLPSRPELITAPRVGIVF
jgi:hypothetical protein